MSRWVHLAVAITVLASFGCTRGAARAQKASAAVPTSEGLVAYRFPPGESGPPPGDSGQTLRVAVPWDFPSFDGHSISNGTIQFSGRLFSDSLVSLDADGRAVPWLAKSWEISPDGRVYTFHLRDDVTFSDGTKFNADAVLANLEHMRDPATKSPLAGRYIDPYHHGEIVDEYTFRAHLSTPFNAFLEVLAQTWLSIYSPKAIRENPKSLAYKPVGSGPFVLESYERQRGLKFVRRPDYNWAPPYTGHRGAAHLERIEVDIITEPFVRAGALASGQYDLILEVPPQSAASVRGDPELVLYNIIRKGLATRAMTFNVEKAPFDDVRVRRALAIAVDRESIARLQGFGEFLPKNDYLARNTRGYDPANADILRYDLREANRLLDESGWTGRDASGFRTRSGERLGADLLVSDASSPQSASVAVQSDFKRVGFELRLVPLPTAQLIERRRTGDYQALSAGWWQTNTPDVLCTTFCSNEISSRATFGQNVSRLANPELDRLLYGARQETDPVREAAFHAGAQKLLQELAPNVPLQENHNLVAASRRVRGLLFDTSHNYVFLTGVWLDSPR